MSNNYHKYLNPTSLEHDWGVYVTAVGYFRAPAASPAAARNHSPFWDRSRSREDFHLILINTSKASHSANAAKGSTCLLLYPGAAIPNDPRAAREVYWIGFNGYYIRHLIDQSFDPADPAPFFAIDNTKEIRKLLIEITKEVQLGNAGYPQKIAGLVLQMLARVKTYC